MRRKRKHPQHKGMSPFKAGLIAVLLIAVGSYFGFTKSNPFASPYELTAAFETANNLKPNSPVRIAGVDVGKVKKIEALEDGGAMVEMEIKDKGLPIHEDATMKIRPRIFLEGNFFVDLQPGSPSAPVQEDGGRPIPSNQTSAPVQFGDVLAALQSDTRSDLQVFLKEYAKGLSGEGARGFNQSLRFGEDAFKNAAIANQATLGREPTKDLQRVLRGQAKTFGALVEDEAALKGLVTNFNTTAGAFAREDVALEASIPLLRDTLRVGTPALASLNGALPSLRAFAVDALPGVRSSGPTLRASLPFIRQARALVGPDELQGAARALRAQMPRLVRLNRRMVPFLAQARLLSSCTNEVLVPFNNSETPNPDEPSNTGTFTRQASRGFVGLSGESRLNDGNNSYFHTSAVPNGDRVRPAPPPDGGSQPPPRRPDVPCETQEPPNLNAPGGPVAQFGGSPAAKRGPKLSSAKFDAKKIQEAAKALVKFEKTTGKKQRERFAREMRKMAEEAGK
jgi:phospholipid/cholesterol/gamma-HCH transport system substrate-binding protein